MSEEKVAHGLKYDPEQHVRCLNRNCGQAKGSCRCSQPRWYLDTAQRLVWFRTEYPPETCDLTTEIVSGLDGQGPIVVKASVHFPDGVTVNAHGSAKGGGTQIWSGREVEKAETAAVGRLLARLGYGTQFAIDDEEESLADSPVGGQTEELDEGEVCPECGATMLWNEGKAKTGRSWGGWFCSANRKHAPIWVYDRPKEAPRPRDPKPREDREPKPLEPEPVESVEDIAAAMAEARKEPIDHQTAEGNPLETTDDFFRRAKDRLNLSKQQCLKLLGIPDASKIGNLDGAWIAIRRKAEAQPLAEEAE